MRRRRKTKILATLGPASSSPEKIRALFEAGVDVFRINMSHTSHDKMRELVGTIRDIEADNDRPIGILVDLQGPKLRLGAFKNDWAEIDAGQCLTLDTDPAPGDATRIHLPHPEIFAAIKPGDTLLIDDGKLRLAVTEARPRVIFFASATSSGRWMNESATQSMPASSAASRSARSLPASAATGMTVSGRLTPLRLAILPPT